MHRISIRRPCGSLSVDVPPESLVAVAGELDLASAPALGDTLRRLDPGCEVVTLDLRALTFMDVAGLHAVVDARSLARATGRRLHDPRRPAAKSRGCSS